jgi:flagellar biosynthesis protein FlhG
MTNLSTTEQAGLIRSFGELSMPVDTLIVDTGAGIDLNVQAFSSACQTVVVVLCDEPTSITDAYALIKVLNARCGIKKFELLANMVDSEAQGRALYGKVCRVSDRFLDVHLGYLGAIPRDIYLRKAVQQQGPVVQLYPRSPSAKALNKLARDLDRKFVGQANYGGLGFFVERLIQGGGAELGA